MHVITKITPTKKIGFNNIYIQGNYSFTISDFTLASFKLKQNSNLELNDIEQILTIELTERFKNYCLNILGSRPRSEKELEQKLKLRILKYKETWPVFGQLKIGGSHSRPACAGRPDRESIMNSKIDSHFRGNDQSIEGVLNSDALRNIPLIDEKTQNELFNTAKNDAFDFLKKYNYLNNKDFAIWLVNQRLNQGKGKMYIKQDLFKKGVSKDIILDVLKNISFSESIKPVYLKALKKYAKDPDDYKKKQKIYRYLLSRGFSMEEVSKVLKFEDY